jgi:predicted acylesterase/phospholipase RssA
MRRAYLGMCFSLSSRTPNAYRNFGTAQIWAKRLYKTGARFDTVQWARKAAFWTHGSTTFKEAYERTGRILNVSVIPYDTHSPTKLLNMHTAPDCLIFTAIIASAAVPGILNPVVLM